MKLFTRKGTPIEANYKENSHSKQMFIYLDESLWFISKASYKQAHQLIECKKVQELLRCKEVEV